MTTELHHIIADAVQDERIIRLQFVCPQIIVQGFFMAAETIKGEGAQLQGRRMVRLKPLGCIEEAKRIWMGRSSRLPGARDDSFSPIPCLLRLKVGLVNIR
ncbi:MAG: hypothetical protein WA702_30095 [Bradyrhizobium sp.]|uniref:hypothetical protein n=1 Tax=Bradyrhizobium sp. TaxID=376 RepID=UPI003C79D3A9